MSRDPRPEPRARAAAALDTGRVVGAHGRHVVVETPDGARVRCHGRGKKSDAVVGDVVRWARAGDEGVVEGIEPRRNLLFRQDEWRTKSFAANLDQLLLFVAVEPVFGESQLTRALVAAAEAGIDTTVALNKIDLPGAGAARARLAPYAAMGVPVLEMAVKPAGDAGAGDAALALLQPLLADRTTLVLGPSGAGKSSLINRLLPGARVETAEISTALGTGRHTTTTTSWYWLDDARTSAIIDSPGFQEFGLRHIEPAQLAALMPDLAAEMGHCRFHNCTHREEPGCGVRAAAEAGRIAPTRWRIYQELHAELSQAPRW